MINLELNELLLKESFFEIWRDYTQHCEQKVGTCVLSCGIFPRVIFCKINHRTITVSYEYSADGAYNPWWKIIHDRLLCIVGFRDLIVENVHCQRSIIVYGRTTMIRSLYIEERTRLEHCVLLAKRKKTYVTCYCLLIIFHAVFFYYSPRQLWKCHHLYKEIAYHLAFAVNNRIRQQDTTTTMTVIVISKTVIVIGMSKLMPMLLEKNSRTEVSSKISTT